MDEVADADGVLITREAEPPADAISGDSAADQADSGGGPDDADPRRAVVEDALAIECEEDLRRAAATAQPTSESAMASTTGVARI